MLLTFDPLTLRSSVRRNKECPTCRKKLVSKRSLRPDPNFDALISKIYPSRDEYEAHQERVLARISKHNNQQALSHSIEEGLKIQAMNRSVTHICVFFFFFFSKTSNLTLHSCTVCKCVYYICGKKYSIQFEVGRCILFSLYLCVCLYVYVHVFGELLDKLKWGVTREYF